jgi:hypothetical protein
MAKKKRKERIVATLLPDRRFSFLVGFRKQIIFFSFSSFYFRKKRKKNKKKTEDFSTATTKEMATAAPLLTDAEGFDSSREAGTSTALLPEQRGTSGWGSPARFTASCRSSS